MQALLRNSLLVSAFALGAAFIGQNANAQNASIDPDNALRWQSVIGILQPDNVVGSGTGRATGGGAPWSTLGGRVNVNLRQGKIDFDVRGLVLAAGNFIGTPGSVLQVKGTLVCDTNGSASGGNSVLVDTPLVDLDDDGNAQFHGSFVGPLPSVCATEPDVAFLIRTGSGAWIANGTVLQ